jgi:ATP-binding protein involved in chromosome partitioning
MESYTMFSFFKRPNNVAQIVRSHVETHVDGFFVLDDVQVTRDGQAIVVLQICKEAPDLERRRVSIEQSVSRLRGIKKAMVVLTGDKRPAVPVKQAVKQKAVSAATDSNGLPPVVIAVASGKGGVGKSTVAVNLALSLSALGKKVGILDADIYGPSLPRLLGQAATKVIPGDDGRLNPVEVYGLKAMSMGFLVDEAAAMIWRGPMVQSALLQMIRDVNWDGLDILLIDMPPGTGDIHLTLAQRVPLSGGVIVSTPQDIALIDARKGLEMFKKVAVPILGIVENMSYYSCPNCGHHDDIFGHGGARAEADKIGVPFLGEIPLHSIIREMSDAGIPVTSSATQSEQAKAFHDIAQRVLSQLSVAQRPPPVIRMEE